MLGLFLQVGSVGFANILQQLEGLGFFSYILPFILIFAVVFAVLRQIKVFEDNMGAAILVSFAIGLLALQLNFVPAFFQDFFPKVGVAVALLVVALILAGSFIAGESAFKWIFFGLGAVIFIILLILQFSGSQYYGSWWWDQYGAMVIVALVIITAMILVMVLSKKKP